MPPPALLIVSGVLLFLIGLLIHVWSGYKAAKVNVADEPWIMLIIPGGVLQALGATLFYFGTASV